jgi:hypothetical protein
MFALHSTIDFIMNTFFKPPWKGAEPTLYAALSAEVERVSGEYYDNCVPCPVSFMAYDDALRQKIWNSTNTIVGTDNCVLF